MGRQPLAARAAHRLRSPHGGPSRTPAPAGRSGLHAGPADAGLLPPHPGDEAAAGRRAGNDEHLPEGQRPAARADRAAPRRDGCAPAGSRPAAQARRCFRRARRCRRSPAPGGGRTQAGAGRARSPVPGGADPRPATGGARRAAAAPGPGCLGQAAAGGPRASGNGPLPARAGPPRPASPGAGAGPAPPGARARARAPAGARRRPAAGQAMSSAATIEREGVPALLVSPQPHASSVSVLLLVRAGSREDPPGQEGMAHLLEHMVFQGTRRRPAPREVVAALDRVGGELNAETDRECTTYS
ncbi:MAG: insulinase family protein, partial [Deltaproteobacteria bacterium]|nr:insulinase family protein [Deltaproteobacteria bacterium]